MTTTTPVTGPFRISVDATPAGATLDITHYLHTLVLALAETADEDGQALLDTLQTIADLDRNVRHRSTTVHERDEAIQGLLDEMVGGGTVPVYGGEVLRLADALRRAVAPRPIPSAREAGAA
ncbi:hypothetical protein ACWCQE_27625 [Streptomyces sp. NPDC002409]|uniref:hypothetical protein n=1 Tax=Streptomyces misionensis TaxID=67331 RepID=UPI003676FEB4